MHLSLNIHPPFQSLLLQILSLLHNQVIHQVTMEQLEQPTGTANNNECEVGIRYVSEPY